jgi:hypothetical protein
MTSASVERGNDEVHDDRPGVLTPSKLNDERLVGRR